MIYEIDPLHDMRWPRFLARHKLAGIFHSPEWLDAVYRTYGYRSAVLTTATPEQELPNALVFCRIQSWLTGNRVVSLPFSDHCAPLVDTDCELGCLLSTLKRQCDAEGRTHIEVRFPSGQPGIEGFVEAAKFHLHRIDLRPSLDELFRRFHASCVRRRILRAMRAGLIYEEGRSEKLLESFYQLALTTRRRQKLPPQPLVWFRNLISCLGDCLKIRLLFLSRRPVAGILTLRYRETMTYKYGFSDQSFHRLGGMQLLLWKAIQDAKAEGLVELDLGRSDWSDDGLAQFKDRWGASRSSMVYLRYPRKAANKTRASLGVRIGRQMCALAPDGILATAGNVLYRHMG